MAPGGGTCRRPRLPPKRVGNVGNLGNLEVDLYVKVLILLYIWKGCQDCQILSLAILNAGLGRPFQAHNHRSCRCGIKAVILPYTPPRSKARCLLVEDRAIFRLYRLVQVPIV
jgi:hypothetical protein